MNVDKTYQNIGWFRAWEEFKQPLLQFSYLDGRFDHNFGRDFHLIILWEKGRFKEKEVLNKISKKFNILYCADITWSNTYMESNFNRLYATSIWPKSNSSKQKTVGGGKFLCIVFEDMNPDYGYVQSCK